LGTQPHWLAGHRIGGFAPEEKETFNRKIIMIMKTTAKMGTLGAALSLVLAAGCAHRTTQYSSYDQSYQTYSPNTRTYENAGPMYNNYTRNTVNKNYSYSPSTSENSTSITATSGNDQVLVTQIRQSLNNNPNLVEVVPNIQVSAQNGTIILNGTVPNERQKQAVETLVKNTSGVLNVNNQLQVNLSPTASKSADKSSRIYTEASSADSGSASGSATTESKGAATDSSALSSGSGSSSSSLSSTNRTSQSSPSQGLPPTSDRPDQEPRLYSTNNTGLSSGPQTSISTDRSAAVSAGVAASQSGTSGSQGGASQSGISGTQGGSAQSSTNQASSSDRSSKSSNGQASAGSATGSTAGSSPKSDNLSSAEHKDLSASADTGQKTSIYSNGPSASLTNDSSRSALYTSAGATADTSASSSNSPTQSGVENKGLSATGNSQTRRYSGANTNSSTTASAAAASTPNAFELNVQGASQADQAIGQKVISELRADTSLAALLPTVRVKIDNGKATLSGTVKSQEEKLKIETAVQKVTGITSVDNQLRVGTASGSLPLK